MSLCLLRVLVYGSSSVMLLNLVPDTSGIVVVDIGFCNFLYFVVSADAIAIL